MAVALYAPHFEVKDGLTVGGQHGADPLPSFHLGALGRASGLEVAVHRSEGAMRQDDGPAGAGNFKGAGDRAAKNGKDGTSCFGGNIDAVVIDRDAGQAGVRLTTEFSGQYAPHDRPR